MWGAIIIALMCRAQTTSQITHEIRRELRAVRREIILMHHFGLIAPIGVKSEPGEEGHDGYYPNILWDLTEHSKSHDQNWEGCRACDLREILGSSVGQ
jgi:hypothetical protein